jgi:archaellum component FlaG (FlaF/FlaG flagellin family)
MFPGGPGAPFFPGGPGMSAGQQPGAANTAAAQATLPAGSFDPTQPQAAQAGPAGATPQDIRVWAHDATTVSGHTYRYMMKYTISNPVGHTSNLCNPQSLAQQFAIVSDPSKWTDNVSVESDTSFYALEVKGHGIHFSIFKWKNGVWQMQDVTAGPGDMVGSVDSAGTKTDFTTGWTVVDVRDDPRDSDNKIVVLVSDTGSIKKKLLNIDTRSAQYHLLLEEVSKTKAAAGGGSPGAPNM